MKRFDLGAPVRRVVVKVVLAKFVFSGFDHRANLCAKVRPQHAALKIVTQAAHQLAQLGRIRDDR